MNNSGRQRKTFCISDARMKEESKERETYKTVQYKDFTKYILWADALHSKKITE
jgi:hypothetical protein